MNVFSICRKNKKIKIIRKGFNAFHVEIKYKYLKHLHYKHIVNLPMNSHKSNKCRLMAVNMYVHQILINHFEGTCIASVLKTRPFFR
jgi:uridine kinase